MTSTVLTAADRASMLQVISDLSKDAYGYRVRLDYGSMTDAELQKTWDGFIRESEASQAREDADAAAQLSLWNAHINYLVQHGARDRKQAIEWDMAAYAVDGDVGYYCWQWGIAYRNEAYIKGILAS